MADLTCYMTFVAAVQKQLNAFKVMSKLNPSLSSDILIRNLEELVGPSDVDPSRTTSFCNLTQIKLPVADHDDESHYMDLEEESGTTTAGSQNAVMGDNGLLKKRRGRPKKIDKHFCHRRIHHTNEKRSSKSSGFPRPTGRKRKDGQLPSAPRAPKTFKKGSKIGSRHYGRPRKNFGHHAVVTSRSKNCRLPDAVPAGDSSNYDNSLTTAKMREADDYIREWIEKTGSMERVRFTCLFCEKSDLPYRYNARIHVRRVHFRDRLACPNCPEKFYNSRMLKTHLIDCTGRRRILFQGNKNWKKYRATVVRNPFRNFDLETTLQVVVRLERMDVSKVSHLKSENNSDHMQTNPCPSARTQISSKSETVNNGDIKKLIEFHQPQCESQSTDINCYDDGQWRVSGTKFMMDADYQNQVMDQAQGGGAQSTAPQSIVSVTVYETGVHTTTTQRFLNPAEF